MPLVRDGTDAGLSFKDRVRTAIRKPRVPAQVRARFRPLTAEMQAAIESSLRTHFFAEENGSKGSAEAYLATPEGKADFDDHLTGRLQQFRTWVVSWLDSLFRLDGARILEIGCGTGASTVALSEQGAQVVGLDVSGAALASARDRCSAYGLQPKFVQANAMDMPSLFTDERFDAILFFAVVEHLTWEERIRSLRAAWELLPAKGTLVVIEAPNRLWYVDIHTTDEPFYNWLPDEAAIAYTRYIGGPSRHLFTEAADEAKVHLARLGRGVSYHDFVVAWNIPAGQLPVLGCMASFHETMWGKALTQLSPGGRYRKLLASAAPDVHPAFLEPCLDVAFRRNEADGQVLI